MKPSYTNDDREIALSKENKNRNRNAGVIPRMVYVFNPVQMMNVNVTFVLL